jgi:hypothetical protein
LVKAFETLGENLAGASNRSPQKAVLFIASDDSMIDKDIEEVIKNAGFDPLKVGGLINLFVLRFSVIYTNLERLKNSEPHGGPIKTLKTIILLPETIQKPDSIEVRLLYYGYECSE